MHACAVKTVSMSQFRQRWTSRAVCSAVKPSSTSTSIFEALDQIDVLHLLARRRVVVVVITPLAETHLLADQVHPRGGRSVTGIALAVVVDRDRRLMAVLDRPDDVLRAPGGVAAEKNAGARGHEGDLVDDRHVPLVEFDPDIALDPREGVLLADGENHVVAGNEDGVDAPVRVFASASRLEALELHPRQLAVLDHEALRRVVDDDLDASSSASSSSQGDALK